MPYENLCIRNVLIILSTCMLCGCPQIFPDHAVKREIAYLKVKCENSETGCVWTGLIKDLMVQYVYYFIPDFVYSLYRNI